MSVAIPGFQPPSATREATVPHQSYVELFARFVRFGLLAWGGPVAQIAMIRQELVEQERWISREQFNRVLAVYQMLPGPEATELCVYFGTLARGRIGGALAGLGFLLPGLLLMFMLSWFYVAVGIQGSAFAAVFHGFQAAVAALIVRAVHRIGEHALTDRWLWAIALVASMASLLGVGFLLTLAGAGLSYLLLKRRQYVMAAAAATIFVMTAVIASQMAVGVSPGVPVSAASPSRPAPALPDLFAAGLRTGLLTFGGAYTAIPFLRFDAVQAGGWMSDAQFLDGLALSGILPAPLVIFSTFVGYLAGGAGGAIVLTAGVFLPAFGFTLIGHQYLERLVERPGVRTVFDGVTAGVVGLIAATTLGLLRAAIVDLGTLVIFLLAVVVLYRWQAKAAVAVVMLGAGTAGWLLFR